MVGERCTHEDLELSCNRKGWNFDLLTDIAAKIPRIADLSIDCSPLIEDPEDLTEDDFAQIAQILKKFQQLSDFSWTASCHYKGIEELDGKDAELHLTRVMSVAASCPSLRRCRILNSVYFHRFLENFWFPYKFGDDDPRMFQYMFDAVNQRKYPPLEELLHYIGYYTRLHGCIQEILKRFKEAETLDVANGGRKEATMDLLAIGQGLGFWPYPEFENHPVTKQLLQAREELSQVEIDGSMYT
ncbi:hypothetical protein VNI00_010853 [Paramarasmius palmivorus]|uniref:Uncharacterized protein n=1 Tax=Paramarasmius palmivorus TaxID=297713 RepID=A0AAW0CDC4_9AGAR